MSYRAEIYEVKRRIVTWLFLLIFLTIILCSLGVEFKPVWGINLPVPSTSAQTLTSTFFVAAKIDLLPSGVDVISTSPITVFLLQIKIALLGSFVVLLPYLLFSFISYLSPALIPKERSTLIILVLSSMFLFISGMVFAYKLIIKSMFEILLSFNPIFNVVAYLEVNEFVGWTLAALFMTGVLFMLPVFMYILSLYKIVGSSFWKAKWREAFIVFLIVSSLITPDVSGISVILLSLPMSFLYALGIVLTLLIERKRRRRE